MEQLETKIRWTPEIVNKADISGAFSERDLSLISEWVWEGFSNDKASRRDWEERNNAGMDLAMQIQKAKNFPWPNCSNIVFPLVSIGSLQFSTRSYSNLIRGTQIYKYRAVGVDPKRKAQAKLLGRHLSWQCLEEDSAWEEQHQRLFMNVSIVGLTFIKSRFSPADRHNVSRLVQARNLVLDYWAESVEECGRKTEIIDISRNRIWENCSRGVYREVREEAWFKEAARTGVVDELNREEHDRRVGLELPQGDRNTPFQCLEQHFFMDCDGDGYGEPYSVVMEAASRKVLRVLPRIDHWGQVEEEKSGAIISITPTEFYTKYGFIPAPDGSIYDMGFGVLLGPLNEAVNTAINQMFDAGTSNLLGGGFASSGAKLRSGVYTRTPGEFKIIKGLSDDIRKSMMPYPEIPVSDVLFKLLDLVIRYADRLAGATETMSGQNPGQNTPAQTYQGMMENGGQIYKSIFKGIWRAMKEEGKKLHRLNGIYLPDSQEFGDKEEVITRELYKSDPNRLIPTADPDVISDQMRIQRATLIRQGAHSVPGYNLEEVENDWLDAVGHDDPQRIFPGPYSDWYKEHPLPNPKVQVEQMRMQGIQAKLEHDKWKVIQGIRADQRKVEAEVEFIHAQAAKLVADVGAEKAAHQLEAFDTIMTHLTSVAEAMNERIAALSAEGGEGEASAGRTGRDQSSPSGSGAMEAAAPPGGESQGPVGGGNV